MSRRRCHAVSMLCATVTLAVCGALSAQTGPDLIIADIDSPQRWGTVAGITGYSFSPTTCNLGDEVVLWLATSNEHPLIGAQLYRLEDGRFEQIGMSWLHHGFCALNQSTCAACQATGCESLGIGCADTSSAAVQGQQGSLGPRSDVNGATGAYGYPFPTIGQSGDAIFKRLQVAVDELDPALHPGAIYFAELFAVTADEPAFANQLNNYSYRPVTVGPFIGSGFELFFDAASSTVAQAPALCGWQEADPEVVIESIDVPGDGRLVLGYRVTDLGGGQFHYEYALFNQTSDRSVRSFSLPVPAGVDVTNIAFSDVDYHSGEPFAGSDWSPSLATGALGWSTETFAQNQNANALRFSTTYSFRFDADAPPQATEATIGLFKPGTPGEIAVATVAPMGTDPDFIRGDADGNGSFTGLVDGFYILNYQFAGGAPPPCLEAADVDGNDAFSGLLDALYAFSFQFAGGPPPPPPGLLCGQDDNYLLGCASVTCL